MVRIELRVKVRVKVVELRSGNSGLGLEPRSGFGSGLKSRSGL